jgi:hypothetical protein
VLHGLDSRCAACGAPRFLLAAPNVSLAGQPSRVGGIAASIAGGGVLFMGLSLSAGLYFLMQALFETTALALAFSLPLAAAAAFFGTLLLLGGSRLRKSGDAKRDRVQLEAVRAMVQHRKGPVSALEVSRSLDIPEPLVDGILMQLARERATDVTVDVDAQGHVIYDFEGEQRRWRVLEEEVEAEQAEAEAERRARR